MVQTFIDGLSAILYLAFVVQHLFKQFTVISSAVLSVNHLWVSRTIHRFANLFFRHIFVFTEIICSAVPLKRNTL